MNHASFTLAAATMVAAMACTADEPRSDKPLSFEQRLRKLETWQQDFPTYLEERYVHAERKRTALVRLCKKYAKLNAKVEAYYGFKHEFVYRPETTVTKTDDVTPFDYLNSDYTSTTHKVHSYTIPAAYVVREACCFYFMHRYVDGSRPSDCLTRDKVQAFVDSVRCAKCKRGEP